MTNIPAFGEEHSNLGGTIGEESGKVCPLVFLYGGGGVHGIYDI